MLSRTAWICLRMLLVCVTVLALSHTALSQLPTATISGVVKDATGAVVPNSTLTAKNLENGQSRTTTSASDGTYRFANLPVGSYELQAEHAGFETQVQSGLTLTVAQEAVVNFSIQVGSAQQTVTVTTEAPLVNLTNSALGGLVSDTKVADLPLNGRNYTDLILMQPGVTRNSNIQATTSFQGEWFSSNGAPLRSNSYLLDGASFVNFFGGAPASTSGSALGVEGILEYRVITNSFGAEYGMTMGSQTVMVTKSGTNTLHGSGFEYLRNSAIAAANYFDTPASSGGHRLPELRRNNFGGSLGGPIKKDKTFIFGAYEGLNQAAGATPIANVFAPGCHGPANAIIWNGTGTPPAGAFNPTSPCTQLGANPAGANTNSVKIAAVVAPLLATWPNPSPGLTNQFSFPQAVPDIEHYAQVRVDHNFSDKDKLFGRYTIVDAYSTVVVNYPQDGNPAPTRQENAAVAEDHIFSSNLLNSFRITYNRTPRHNYQTDTYTGPQYNFLPTVQIAALGEPQSTFLGGLSVPGITAHVGADPSILHENFWTLGDDVFLTRGRHSLKFGTLMNMEQFNDVLGTGMLGSASFTSIGNFFQGIPSTISGLNPGSNTARHFIFYTYGFYVQDDFHLRPNLTLNLGLRYEFTTQITERDGIQSAIRNIVSDNYTIGVPFVRPRPDNFSPRLGFAWDVRGDGKTSVRGGAALLYDMLTNLGNGYNGLATGSPPFSSNFSVSNPGTLTIPFTIPQNVASSISLRLFDYYMHQPKLLTYSLTVERQLPIGIAATLSYTGTKGYNLMQNIEGNPAIPQGIRQNGATGPSCVARPAGTAVDMTSPFDTSSATSCWIANNPRRNPNIGTIQYWQAKGNSYYNSLQFSLVKRVGHGLQFQSAYTWSHLIDNRNGDASADTGTNGLDGSDPLLPLVDRANADYDQRQAYHFNAIWNLPNSKSDNVFLKKALNGWWMSGIFAKQTGLPLNVTLSGNRSRSLVGGGSQAVDRPDLVAGRTAYNITHGVSTSNGIDPCPTAGQTLGTQKLWFDPCAFTIPTLGFLGTEGRNWLTGPGLTNLDFSLVKDTHFTSREGVMLQFRTEVFNIMNHPNFSPPSANAYAPDTTTNNLAIAPQPTAGLISSTYPTTARQIQFALKLLF